MLKIMISYTITVKIYSKRIHLTCLLLQNISLSLIYLKNYEETLVYCDKVLEIKPSDTYALKNKIFALESLKKYDEVLKLCEGFW